MRTTLLLAAVAALFGTAQSALADPCEGALPKPGARFSGVVRYVGDGDSLCVGPRHRPDRWIEVRLADFRAPELSEPDGERAKRHLVRAAMGRAIACVAVNRTYDRIAARCTVNGRALGDELRRGGAPVGGR